MENFNLKDELLNYYFHSINDLIRKNHNSRYIENFGHQNPSKKSSLVSMLLHHITIEYIINLKKLYEGAWNPNSLIMDYYMFLVIPLKVHYVMTIQKLSMKFIHCDYIIYNIVMLNHFSF
jgi:hypothetical protein